MKKRKYLVFSSILISLVICFCGDEGDKDGDKKEEPPVIDKIIPDEGFAGDTIAFSIIGNNFKQGDKVFIGTASSNDLIKIENVLKDTISGKLYPGLQAGTYDVKVERDSVNYDVLESAFTLKVKDTLKTICDKYIRGELKESGRLVKVCSPYFVSGDLKIPSGKLLVIEKGVELSILHSDSENIGASGFKVELIVEGRLIINGEENEKVKITPYLEEPYEGAWGGINVSGELDFNWVEISYPNNGLFLSDFANVRLNNVIIDKAAFVGLSCYGGSKIIAKNSKFGSLEGALVLRDSAYVEMDTVEISTISNDAIYIQGIAELHIRNSTVSGGRNGINIVGGNKVEIKSSEIKKYQNYGIIIVRDNDLELEDLNIKGGSVGMYFYRLSGSIGGLYKKLRVQGCSNTGISIEFADTNKHPVFENIVIKDCGTGILVLNFSKVIVRNSFILNSYDTSEGEGYGAYVLGISRPIFDRVYFEDNYTGAVLMGYSRAEFKHCWFVNNQTYYILAFEQTQTTIDSCLFSGGAGGKQRGIGGNGDLILMVMNSTIKNLFSGVELYNNSKVLNFEKNNIYGNSDANFWNKTNFVQTAINNWWGTTDEELIERGFKFHGSSLPDNETIYKPYATSPFPEIALPEEIPE